MIPKRVSDRLVRGITKFQQVLQIAKDRDVNESDTVSIIKDLLAEVFGYDKYLDVTSEFAVRGTFCDLAIKVENKVEFMIEAKAVGLDLKEGHLRQAIEYGANKGVQWVILKTAWSGRCTRSGLSSRSTTTSSASSASQNSTRKMKSIRRSSSSSARKGWSRTPGRSFTRRF